MLRLQRILLEFNALEAHHIGRNMHHASSCAIMRQRRNMSVELLDPVQFFKQIKKLIIANQAACFHHFEQLLFAVAIVSFFSSINR